MTDKSDGGPAFPMIVWKSPDGLLAMPSAPGMSLRDWFAGQALVSMGTWVPARKDGTYPGSQKEILNLKSRWSYEMADAMLAAREVV